MILAGVSTIVLLSARFIRPATFRGVGGNSRKKTLSEVWFALIALPVFGITWLWLQRPLIGLACLLYMAFGDCVTGIVRSLVYHRPTKGLWGSLAMFAVSFVISLMLIKPLWIGVAGATAATAAEWAFGETGLIKYGDDNWAVPLAGLIVILVALKLTENL